MWASNQMIAIYIAGGVLLFAGIACLMLRKTLRSRLDIEKNLASDPDINDWLILFNWSPKILYVPTIILSLVCAFLMFLKEVGTPGFGILDGNLVGGIWFAVFLFNFLIEEYNLSVKVLLITLVAIGFFLLWLHLLGWVKGFFGLFGLLGFSISATGYLLMSVVGILTVLVSWTQGLFHYVTVTPNYINIQTGPTEAGEQIGREDYNTRIDTTDFMERLLGFGRIVITFRNREKEPMSFLVWRIEKKARLLEQVRAKIAIDYPQKSSALGSSSVL